MKTAYLNPYGQSALEILQDYGNITQITHATQEINNIIENTYNQDLRKINTIRELCYDKIRYYYQHQIDKKTNKYNYLFTPLIENADTIATHTLLQTVAVNYGSTSSEADMITQLISNTIQERLTKNTDEELIDETLSDYLDITHTTINDILPLIKDGKLKLNQILVNKNRVILTYNDFLEEYQDYLKHRRPETMYKLLCSKSKKDILTALIQKQTIEYIKQVESQLKQIEPAPIIKTLAHDIKKIETQQKEEIIQKQYGNKKGMYTSFNDDKPTAYITEAFPPCIRRALQGTRSGGRNFTISLFLTPFLSYARLYPGVYSRHIKKPEITDMDPHLSITRGEILPLIERAAQNCTPPLFTDQPQEKTNIHSKLGFGEGEINIENCGKTPWYTPMNCTNLKQQQPSLCTPCTDCQKIGNPLSYYNRKRKLLIRKGNKDAKNGN